MFLTHSDGVRVLDEREDVRGAIRSHGRAWQEAYSDLSPDDVLDRVTVDPSDEVIGERYVDPDYWRQGVGTRLLECGIDRLPDGTERRVLEAFADNDVARSFYEARGFERIDESEFEIAGER